MEAGMDDYIAKPFDPGVLLKMIGRLLTAGAAQPAEAPAAEPEHALPSVDSPPPLDRDALVARCMGNLELAQELLSDFEGDLSERVDQIARHVRQGDAQATVELAHALKGAAGTMTAESLQALAAAIEAAGKTGDLTSAVPLADRLGDEAHRCLHFIPELQGQLKDI
jgi:HPt (histidine-containing phosphotransfer) domain-containing protein